MNSKKLLLSVFAGLTSVCAWASGFSLYEPSAISTAMGGALVGKAMDASANFNNPATLTDLSNIVFSVGLVTEHPRGTINGARNGSALGDIDMNAGCFVLPHLQLAIPLPYDFAFGLGMEPEYGLGTRYSLDSPISWNARKTTVQGFVINPNIAYKITPKWSIGAGLRWLYFDFEQWKEGMYVKSSSYVLGPLNYHLKGDNGFKSIGWQIGTKYDILDNLSVGVVYKSPIDVTVEGNTDASSNNAYGKMAASRMNGDAEADITLPQSVTAGLNWDVTDTVHLGMAVSWTEWSEFDTLIFEVQPADSPVKLDWEDTMRYSVGLAWDLHEDWTWMMSYTFDMDCTSSHQDSVMLPPVDRHILGAGLTWRCWRGLELTVCYNCIFMQGNDMSCEDAKDDIYDLSVRRGFCHAGGFSVTYRF